MIPFLKELTEEFRKVCPQSYLEYNTKKEVIYPYLTFSYSGEALENTREGFYIDINIFDNCEANTVELEQLTTDVKKHFENCKIFTNDMLLQFKYLNRHPIPTNHKVIKRRWMQIYCKIDWRN